MNDLIIESLQIYFVFFALVRKWNLPSKLFKDGFWRKLFNCSFCFATWSSLILGYLGVFYFYDFAPIAIICLLIDSLLQKLNG